VDSKTYKDAVNGTERLLDKLSREEILCVLIRVTVNAIHVIEDQPLRERVEREYIKALAFVSMLEERKQTLPIDEPAGNHDAFVDTVMREIIASLSVTDW
jgi:hypothetical protein